MSPRVDVVVTVDDGYVDRLGDVVTRLRAAGMDVKETLDAIGAVTGSIDESQLHGLDDVEGVEHVERARQYRVAPPDSPIQ